MSKKPIEINLPQIKMTKNLSQKAVQHLMKKHGIDEKQVAKWFNSSPAYIKKVARKEKPLLPRHLKYLKDNNPGEYSDLWESVCAQTIGETLDAGTDFIRKKSSQGFKFLRSIGTEAALTLGKLLTKDDS